MSQLPSNCSTEFFSKHFKKSEFISDVFSLNPSWQIATQELQNLIQLNLFLEFFRYYLNNVYYFDSAFMSNNEKKIVISSAYRTKTHNKEVGGVPNSMHCVGLAVDFSVPGMSSDELYIALANFHSYCFSCDERDFSFSTLFNSLLLLELDFMQLIDIQYVHIEFKYKCNYGY